MICPKAFPPLSMFNIILRLLAVLPDQAIKNLFTFPESREATTNFERAFTSRTSLRLARNFGKTRFGQCETFKV